MGLSNFPSAAEGVLPVLVMNTVLSVALLKNMMRSVLEVMMGTINHSPMIEEEEQEEEDGHSENCYHEAEATRERRRVSITQFKSLFHDDDDDDDEDDNNGSTGATTTMECCVCLSGFEEEEEVSELSCKHFFHKSCLDKWFDNYQHSTCPLCRSVL